MKKHALLLLPFVAALCLTGCKRDYKVIHARPVVDSAAAAAEHQEESSIAIPDSVPAPLDEPLIDIPDIPDEVALTNTDGQDEYENYIHGR